MKKFASLILAGTLALSLLAVGASADGEVIKRGTATVDGTLDAAYTGSLSIAYGPESNEWVYNNWDESASVTTYYMYDDNNLYLFADVIDDEVVSAGEAAATDPSGTLNETNDLMMWRLSLDGTTNVIKVGIDAYGYNLFGLPAHYDIIDYDEMEYAAVITDDGYHIEASVPCSKGMTDMIAAGKLGIAMELGDLKADGDFGNMCWATPGGEYNAVVFYDLSDEVAVAAPGATEDTTPVADDTTANAGAAEDTTANAGAAEDTTANAGAAEDTTANNNAGTTTPGTSGTTTPDTFDPMVVTLAVTAASGAAYIVISKAKKH